MGRACARHTHTERKRDQESERERESVKRGGGDEGRHQSPSICVYRDLDAPDLPPKLGGWDKVYCAVVRVFSDAPSNRILRGRTVAMAVEMEERDDKLVLIEPITWRQMRHDKVCVVGVADIAPLADLRKYVNGSNDDKLAEVIHARVHTHTHTQPTHTHTHTCACTHTNTQTHKHTNTQTHKHTNTQTHKHTHTHTHTHIEQMLVEMQGSSLHVDADTDGTCGKGLRRKSSRVRGGKRINTPNTHTHTHIRTRARTHTHQRWSMVKKAHFEASAPGPRNVLVRQP